MRAEEKRRLRWRRAGGARRRRRWAALLVASWLALVPLWVGWRSEALLRGEHRVSASLLELRVRPEPALVDRGRHVATVLAQCTFCHGTDLAGREIADDRWLGRLYAANLTAGEGGVGRRYTAADWVQAIRYGIAPDGRSLLLMPSQHLSRISDGDLAALIAFLQQVPSIDAEHPATLIGPLTRVVLAAGLAPDLVTADRVDRNLAPPEHAQEGATAEYGAYLVSLGSCRVCHREDLRGGLHPLSLPDEPPPPDLRPGGAMRGWTRHDFARAMRSGRTPDGRLLDREFMPWPSFAGLAPVELEALWLYLSSLESPERDPGRLIAATRSRPRPR